MNKYYYDLHIHSCLSPCADNDMTPNNIAGMAALNGLNIVALTDHNSTDNCPAFFEACKKYGIVAIPGIELTTAEDVHIVCLFESLPNAMAFGREYRDHRILYKNKSEIFGDQLVVNERDEVMAVEENLLLNASDLSIEEAFALAEKYGAAIFPAHIDREENGIISALGCIPPEIGFNCIEFNQSSNIPTYTKTYKLENKLILTDSDAHYLWNINEAENFLMLDDEPYSSALIRKRLIDKLSGKEIPRS